MAGDNFIKGITKIEIMPIEVDGIVTAVITIAGVALGQKKDEDVA